MASLRQKTITGVAWNLAEQFVVRGISVFVTLMLAYFLNPEDFGLVAMMTVFISIATSLMDSGFTQALIRLPAATQLDFNTAFYTNIALGIVSYILLFSAAPLIADFYQQDQLIALLRVAGLVVIINVFQVVQYACLSRALNFKVQFRAAFPASLISALVAISLAYFGFGVWALIAQMLISALMTTIFLWIQKSWRPSISWSRVSFRGMFDFGYKLFLAALIETVFKNVYVLVIAKIFSVGLAGLYFFADKIREAVLYQSVFAFQKVLFPALSSMQGEPDKLASSFRSTIIASSYIFSLLILLLFVIPDMAFQLLLPEKWWEASGYFKLMCLACFLLPCSALNLNLLQVMGRSDLFLIVEVIKKLIAILVLILSYRFGVEGILIGQIVISIIAYFVNSYFAKELVNYSTYFQLKDISPSIFLAIFVAILTQFIGDSVLSSVSWLSLITMMFVALLMFVFLSYFLSHRAYELTWCFIFSKLRKIS